MQIEYVGRGHVAFTLGLDVSGREHVVLICKTAFLFPERDGDVCQTAETTDPPVMADTFFGEPGLSAAEYETDFATFKPQCDLLLNASAHVPGGQPTAQCTVGINIGNVRKVFDVIGHREWQESVIGVAASNPHPFITMPISYDVAFGGTDDVDPDEELHDAYVDNPVGRGWHRRRNQGLLQGRPLPNTQAPDDQIEVPWGRHRPMSFGVVGRGWPERLKFAGTYDQAWLDDIFPFLPKDFDPRYFQAAPSDQQIAYPSGGELVSLLNLTPEGRTSFRLPPLEMPVVFGRRRAEDAHRTAVADTLMIEPNRRMIHITWRATLPLERDIFEVREAIVGRHGRGFWRARSLGKTYMRGLKALGKTDDGE